MLLFIVWDDVCRRTVRRRHEEGMSAFREGLLDLKDPSYGLNPLTCGCKLAIIGWTIAETD